MRGDRSLWPVGAAIALAEVCLCTLGSRVPVKGADYQSSGALVTIADPSSM